MTTYLALQHSRRPKQAARQRLLTARDLAQKQDARALIGKVDRALARLGSSQESRRRQHHPVG
jgi:hypothetical protein